MKPRHAAALALVSAAAFASLIIVGAIWAVLVLNAVLLLVPRWLANFRNFPWNPSGILGAFNAVVFVLLMVPWAALCAWGCWAVEGAWLDLLDPNGRIATDDPRLKEK